MASAPGSPLRCINRRQGWRYAGIEELFRRLVAEFPEFSIWSNMTDHQATRAELRSGLAGLQTVLESMACGRVPDQRRDALARAYRSALGKPIAPAGEMPAELQIQRWARAISTTESAWRR